MHCKSIPIYRLLINVIVQLTNSLLSCLLVEANEFNSNVYNRIRKRQRRCGRPGAGLRGTARGDTIISNFLAVPDDRGRLVRFGDYVKCSEQISLPDYGIEYPVFGRVLAGTDAN